MARYSVTPNMLVVPPQASLLRHATTPTKHTPFHPLTLRLRWKTIIPTGWPRRAKRKKHTFIRERDLGRKVFGCILREQVFAHPATSDIFGIVRIVMEACNPMTNVPNARTTNAMLAKIFKGHPWLKKTGEMFLEVCGIRKACMKGDGA